MEEQKSEVIERLIPARVAAPGLGLTEAQVYHYVRTGQLPCVRLGRRVLFSPSALQRWQQGTK